MPSAPTPTGIKILQGNPGHRPLPAAEPQFEGGAEAPAWLTPDALMEWHRLAPILEKARVLTVADRDVLALYCAQLSDITARVKCAMSIDPREYAELRQYMAQLGLTPAARTKVKASKPPAKSKLERFTA